MKHLLVLLVLLLLGYCVWQASDRPERKSAMKAITYHGFRIGALVLVLLLLVAAAVYLPSSSIL